MQNFLSLKSRNFDLLCWFGSFIFFSFSESGESLTSMVVGVIYSYCFCKGVKMWVFFYSGHLYIFILSEKRKKFGLCFGSAHSYTFCLSLLILVSEEILDCVLVLLIHKQFHYILIISEKRRKFGFCFGLSHSYTSFLYSIIFGKSSLDVSVRLFPIVIFEKKIILYLSGDDCFALGHSCTNFLCLYIWKEKQV